MPVLLSSPPPSISFSTTPFVSTDQRQAMSARGVSPMITAKSAVTPVVGKTRRLINLGLGGFRSKAGRASQVKIYEDRYVGVCVCHETAQQQPLFSI